MDLEAPLSAPSVVTSGSHCPLLGAVPTSSWAHTFPTFPLLGPRGLGDFPGANACVSVPSFLEHFIVGYHSLSQAGQELVRRRNLRTQGEVER